MEKVIIFGAGQNYKKNKQYYEERYDVVGIVDNNYDLIHYENIHPISYIGSVDFDKILITPNDYIEIFNQLVEIGIPSSKIKIMSIDCEMSQNIIAGNKYWGQHADDLIIEAIFSQIGILKPSYIDLGCNHPVELSNTIALYLDGCRGINVDANPIMIDCVKKVKPEDICLNVGVAKEKRIMPFYIKSRASGENTFSFREMEKWGDKPESVINVPVVTLEDIVKEYCSDGFPDFLDCDIEGLDYEVLESYDLENNGPKVICVEVRQHEIEKFDRMLNKKGFYRFCRIGENNIYVKKIYSEKVSHMTVK